MASARQTRTGTRKNQAGLMTERNLRKIYRDQSRMNIVKRCTITIITLLLLAGCESN